MNVPVGTTTKVGYGTSLGMAVAALLALIFTDADEQTLAVISAGLISLASLVVTSLGRYGQAKELVRNRPKVSGAKITALNLSGAMDLPAPEDIARDTPVTPGDPVHEQRDLHDGEAC